MRYNCNPLQGELFELCLDRLENAVVDGLDHFFSVLVFASASLAPMSDFELAVVIRRLRSANVIAEILVSTTWAIKAPR
jgi:hypothetical protein